MPYFDRFDICEAHHVMEIDWNRSGVLWERPSNSRRMMSTDFQLHRIMFRPGISIRNAGFCGLTDNGKEIYFELCERYGFNIPAEYLSHEFEYNSDFEGDEDA